MYSLPLSGLRASLSFSGAILFGKQAWEEMYIEGTRSSLLLEGWTGLCGESRR